MQIYAIEKQKTTHLHFLTIYLKFILTNQHLPQTYSKSQPDSQII